MKNDELISNCQTEKNRLELHFIYMFSIFTVLIAFLISDRWTDKPNFTEYLTNIATFVSVVLGLVAIFYSFISNSSVSRSIGTMSKASEDVVEARNQIEKVLDHAVQLEGVAEESAISLKNVSSSLDGRITSLNDTLAVVAEKTDLLHRAMETIPGRIDQLESRFIDAGKPKEKTHDHSLPGATGGFPKAAILDYLKYSSVSGRFLIYSCVLAFGSKKPLSLQAISEIIGSSQDYLFGYLIASNAMDIIDKTDTEEMRVWDIAYVNQIVADNIKDIMINEIDKKYKDNERLARKNHTRIQRLDELFQE